MTGISTRAAMRLAGLVVCGGLVAGCGARLYNQENDKQAALLKEKISAVKFDDTFKTARENHKVLSDTMAESAAAALRKTAELKLLRIVSTGRPIEGRPDGRLQPTLRDAWSKVAGSLPANNASNRTTLRAGVAAYELGSEPSQVALGAAARVSAFGPKPKACEAKRDAGGKPVFANGEIVLTLPTAAEYIADVKSPHFTLSTLYDQYLTACRQLLVGLPGQAGLISLETLFEGAGSGSAKSALDQWRTAHVNHMALRDAALAAKKQYDIDKKAYQTALDALDKSKPGAVDAAKKLAEKAGKALKAVETVNEHGVELASKERIEELREIISLLSSDGKDDAAAPSASTLTDKTRKHLAAISEIPELIDDTAQLFIDARKARLTPLKLELAYQQQLLSNAQRAVELALNDVKRQQQLFLAYAKYAREIDLAIEAAARVPLRDEPLYRATFNKDEGKNLQTALRHYFTAEYLHRVEIDALNYTSVAETFQRSVNADEASLAQWRTLVEGETIILSEYHASGVKPESLGQLFASLMLLAIAIGVN